MDKQPSSRKTYCLLIFSVFPAAVFCIPSMSVLRARQMFGSTICKLSNKHLTVTDNWLRPSLSTSFSLSSSTSLQYGKILLFVYFEWEVKKYLTPSALIERIRKANEVKAVFKNFPTRNWTSKSLKRRENDWRVLVHVWKKSKPFCRPRIKKSVTRRISVGFRENMQLDALTNAAQYQTLTSRIRQALAIITIFSVLTFDFGIIFGHLRLFQHMTSVCHKAASANTIIILSQAFLRRGLL